MSYRFRLEPMNPSGLTLDDYAARFLSAGLEPGVLQDTNIRRFLLRNQGMVVVTQAPDKGGLYAEVRIGLTTLHWDAVEIRPRVETWVRLAEQTDSKIFDGHTEEPLVDEPSIAACLERIVAKRRACFKGGKAWVVRKDFNIRL
jgi:hypothetical protein